jgi:glycosyltransferase involved in cell wall biosynthesis
MKQLKILHIILSLNVGGAERMVSDFIRNDRSGTCRHLVCCLDSIGVFGEELIQEGVTVVHIPRRPGKDWRLIFKLANFIRKVKIDVVHTHGETPWFYGALATQILFMAPVKCITTIHGYGGGDRASVSDYKLWRFLAKMTAKIVVVADNLRAEMVKVGFSRQQVSTILNGVDPQLKTENSQTRPFWGLSDDDFVIGIVARLSPIKNHQLLFRAVKTLVLKDPTTKLLVVGDGPERPVLEGLAQQLDLNNNIVFCGEQSQAQTFYPLFDVFVLPSLSEGISMTLLEAQAAKVPVVASAVGGNCEVICDGETGLLFTSGDVDGLYRHLETLCSSVDTRKKLINNGFERVRDMFNIQMMIKQYLQIYVDVSSGK